MSNEDDIRDVDAAVQRYAEDGDAYSEELTRDDVPLLHEPPKAIGEPKTLDKREREQIIDLRDKLFDIVNALVVISLVGGFALMIVYMFVMRSHLDYRVLLAWYSGVALQSVGVLAVIARSLFPGGRRGR